jgi:hypothetical protein
MGFLQFSGHCIKLTNQPFARKSLISFTADGAIKLKNHLEFIEMRRTGEEYACSRMIKMIELSLLSDILLGMGKPIQEHTGNLRISYC